MSFQFSDQHIDDYQRLGYTVFRGILPPSLIDDLRRVTDEARVIAREKQGPQTQRLQPVSAFDIDQQPFHDFRDLPELRDAVARILTPHHTYGTEAILGVLLEPADEPYCTAWHRDWRDNVPGLKLSDWDAVMHDIDYFNQLNCALYEDNSTWVVPGSHLRRDLPGEAARFPERPIPYPDLEGKSSAGRELACLEYCRSLPGAQRLHLDAGDFALYRNSLWHLGNYVPYRKRATLHDAVDTPAFAAWRDKVLPEATKRREAGLHWENPNAPHAAASTE
jgi:ectoine hydroxylase-related dioxygenase (phytanoyl-CoA dioxygenase family)